MESQADVLKDCLLSLAVRVREIRALSLVDAQGLPLVSSLGPGVLEETMSAFCCSISMALSRAQGDFEMGPMYGAHFVGRDRQIFVTPVTDDATLVAIVDAQATPATITMHLLALAKQVAVLLVAPRDAA